MNKILYTLIAGFMLLSATSASAKGGFVQNMPALVTIQEVLQMPDDSIVYIQGYILNNVKDDNYTFYDGQDNIIIEVDDDAWNGMTITPQHQIIIVGEVDKDDNMTIVEVDEIMLAK